MTPRNPRRKARRFTRRAQAPAPLHFAVQAMLAAVADAPVERVRYLADKYEGTLAFTEQAFAAREPATAVGVPDFFDEWSSSNTVTADEIADALYVLHAMRTDLSMSTKVRGTDGYLHTITLAQWDKAPVRVEFRFPCVLLHNEYTAFVRWDTEEQQYILEVGCQEHSLAAWRTALAKVVEEQCSHLDDDCPTVPQYQYPSIPVRWDYTTEADFRAELHRRLDKSEALYQRESQRYTAWKNSAKPLSNVAQLQAELPCVLDAIEAKIAAALKAAPKQAPRKRRRKARQ